jgi:iron complex outermembrane receptor protein
VPDIYPNGFLPFIKADVSDESLVSGVRGDLGRWKYDLSANFGRDSMSFATENSDNPNYGDTSPTSFQDGGLRYQEYLLNLDLQRDVPLSVFKVPLSVAWGFEYRAERFAITAGDQASYDDGISAVLSAVNNPQPQLNAGQVFPGFQPQNALDKGRHSSSAYVDLEQDLTSKWTLDMAARAERYSDFGSTLNLQSGLPGECVTGIGVAWLRIHRVQSTFIATAILLDRLDCRR